ncbi:DeoR/GlpR family DNA-binding transcription regulator [Ruminococcaceae bacterium OttesenSCG-928-O06]|nr:DeoR/GlpR family DNA-binding transcription regulator [Ruminococcaceae bacterium OttesenSCG-928-O06]
MIRAERIRQIAELASRDEIVTLNQLAQELGVSKATIRRDVDELYAQGLIQKTRGGIIFQKESSPLDPTYAMRLTVNMEEKNRIAKAARSYVQEGDNIMFDSGSTLLELAKELPVRKHLGIITYDLYVALELINKEYVDLLMIGGVFRRQYFGFHGYFAENAIRQMYAGVSFIGADAVDLQGGIMSHNQNDVPLKQCMIDNSQKTILLCDHTKFGSSAFIHVAPLSRFDIVITGRALEEKYVTAMREKGIEVQLV